MKKKMLIGAFAILICLSLVGCSKSSNSEEISEESDEEVEYTYNEGFPTSDIVSNIPEVSFGDINYYEYDDSITIYIENSTEEEYKDYINSLSEYGWITDENSEDTVDYYSASNEYGESINISYYDTEMIITIYN